MNYVVEKKGIQPNREQTYEIKYFRKALDREGNEVEVVDDKREIITLKQLEGEKVKYEKLIGEINTKLAQIGRL